MAAARRRVAVAVVPDLPEPTPSPAGVPDGQGVLLPALVPPPDTPPRVLVPLRRFDWERVLRESDASRGARLVGLTLATYANRDGSDIFPGEQELAKGCRMGASTARAHVKELIGLGLLECVRRGGGPGHAANVYRLVAPEGTPLSTQR